MRFFKLDAAARGEVQAIASRPPVERRSAGRPWTAPSAADTAPAAALQRASGDDTAWDEF
jgi:hypothetical protein